MPARRTVRRDTLYPHKRTIAFSEEQNEQLCRQAERLDCGVATLVREAAAAGLTYAVDRRRKRNKRTTRSG